MKLTKLVIASQNPHKIEELEQILRPLGIEVLSTKGFPELKEVVEDQPTLQGNALKKARYVAKETGLPALSDDTGLEVDSLNGEPGVYSARYAGKRASYQDNVNKLLTELDGITDRKAQFRTVVALVHSDKEYVFEGICKGEILTEEKGDKGFGYDPVFKPEGFDKTFAELDSAIKNDISHRGKAVQKFVSFLKR
ncbi:MAG: RdgB/HAM1 family non-canonical purine NTP pyrophosphatase [Gracilimonas sp.]|uniref:RdgB/HAM1 family non-canonical purine NTP pyrophosphatase n=1 Tax=Gracilimonas TaxID=649462 RepID=UPI001B02A3BF|nr:RdgB/HAM1 family non-canonical purine NTP pyrophosphatase [Gracilimonas sp.]MBO6585731.1 RdgB/HAM1 family non-canonical purine NTP pyrophosphatase [Gracilimonas sp.]MBO6616728.1 RdgB/HAM1 family non-canonical purine NTP pyrophosphatase [Gracilimonas sp.]